MYKPTISLKKVCQNSTDLSKLLKFCCMQKIETSIFAYNFFKIQFSHLLYSSAMFRLDWLSNRQ